MLLGLVNVGLHHSHMELKTSVRTVRDYSKALRSFSARRALISAGDGLAIFTEAKGDVGDDAMHVSGKFPHRASCFHHLAFDCFAWC
jgi:hypothetical protein